MKAAKVKGLDAHESLVENSARIVTTRLAELRSFVPAALEPDNSPDQHAMRIAAKRLRYVLELTEFCFGRPGEVARKRAKELTEVLGELHDCDVMLPRIEGQIEQLRSEDAGAVRELAADADDLDPALSARAPHRTAYRGLEVLGVHIVARRMLLFDRFVALWEEIEAAGAWRKLERAIDRKVAAARERRAAAERAARAARELAEAEEARRAAEQRARSAARKLEEARRAQQVNGAAPGEPEGDQPPSGEPAPTSEA